MTRSTYALSLSLVAASVSGLSNTGNTRRAFFAKVPALAGSSAAMGWFVNFDNHETNCACETCTHSLSLGPQTASAYERDVGGTSMSAETAAFNLQARKTNARLEKDGFKLDTKEEEQARLADAMASFSYESSTSGKKQSSRGNKNRAAAEQKK
jgi:hypothetical protein